MAITNENKNRIVQVEQLQTFLDTIRNETIGSISGSFVSSGYKITIKTVSKVKGKTGAPAEVTFTIPFADGSNNGLITKENLAQFLGYNTTISNLSTNKVDKVSGKGLSANDYTTTEKNKLNGVETGAQVNVIETVKVNGTALTPTSKEVNIDLTPYAKKSELGSPLKYKGSLDEATGIPPLTSVPISGMYNVGFEFTTTADFVEGAGKKYPAGTNIVKVNDGITNKWDIFGGYIDLTPFAKQTDVNTMNSTLNTTKNTVDTHTTKIQTLENSLSGVQGNLNYATDADIQGLFE